MILAPAWALALGLMLGLTPLAKWKLTAFGLTGSPVDAFLGAFIMAHLVIVFFRSHANADVRTLHPVRFWIVPPALLLLLVVSGPARVVAAALATWWDVYHSSLQTFGLGRIFDHKAAFIVTDILADRSARSLTFGLENVLATPFWSAVKTGTSKDMRDNWCVGYSDRFTVGVWVGNFDGGSMQDVSGVTGAAPIWLETMRYLHQSRPARPPAAPTGVVASNVKYFPEIENERREWFVRGTELSEVRLQDSPDIRLARITYPGRGTILALDPDMPSGVERVFFEMTPENANLHWQLDGAAFGFHDGWKPSHGHHRLTLVDVSGAVQDEVVFEVRGMGL